MYVCVVYLHVSGDDTLTRHYSDEVTAYQLLSLCRLRGFKPRDTPGSYFIRYYTKTEKDSTKSVLGPFMVVSIVISVHN
jgi:hypothetical protein